MKLELSRQEILALYKDSMSDNRYADDSIIIFSRKLLEEAAKVCDDGSIVACTKEQHIIINVKVIL